MDQRVVECVPNFSEGRDPAVIRRIVDAIGELDNLRSEWDALGLSGTLTPENFVGENEGLMGDDIAGVYTTHAALKALMAQGHATNLYKVK